MSTASERRATGEAEFCDCGGCVTNGAHYLMVVSTQGMAPFLFYSRQARNAVGATLRACVLQALLTGWGDDAEPAHVHTFVNADDFTGNAFCECGEQR